MLDFKEKDLIVSLHLKTFRVMKATKKLGVFVDVEVPFDE